MLFAILSKYSVSILGTLLCVSLVLLGYMLWNTGRLQTTIDKQNVELGVVAAMSQQQQVKIIESKNIEERIKVLTQDKIKYVTEYVYDTNKTECDNAIDRMRTVF